MIGDFCVQIELALSGGAASMRPQTKGGQRAAQGMSKRLCLDDSWAFLGLRSHRDALRWIG